MTHNAIKGKTIRVYVGLSGGVDSSVSAALLLKAGYDVTGVFIKVWQPDWIDCTWKEERREAMRAAAHLGIKFETLDLSKEYKQDVIDYMIREYSLGRTPNPDVMCNRYVKFGGFWKSAKERGADYVATGHYARVQVETAKGSTKNPALPLFKLQAGTDTNKDQSYFLWTLNQNDLRHVLFPVGHLAKPEVRKLAAKFKLPNAEKRDSQGLCFIGKVNLKDFLRHYIKSQTGNVLDENGCVIGTHPGALFFTRGERHGFTITKKSPNDGRFYVTGKNMETNEIIVSDRHNSATEKAGSIVKISNVNWVRGVAPAIQSKANAFNLQARGRYRQALSKIRIISATASHAEVEYQKADETLASGQSLVIYDGEECLGGGVIE